MKKIMLLSVILFFTVSNGVIAQFANVNPIPSYNYQMTTQSAGFQESGSGETREKRDMQVEITTSSDAMTDIFATVWIVKKNGTEVLGPFTVLCNEVLSVNLPKGKWGVVINCSWQVIVSVWIEKVHQTSLNDILENNGKPVFPITNLFPTI
jgi:hypothetical protein